MWIGHRKEIRLSDRSMSLRWPIHIVKKVDKTKLTCNTLQRPVSLETYPFIKEKISLFLYVKFVSLWARCFYRHAKKQP